MIEAIWTIEFKSGDKSYGAGILVFAGGRVFGGDSNFYYIGRYAVNGGRVCLRTTVHPYNDNRSTDSIFGARDTFDVELAGQVEQTQMVLAGAIVGEANQTLTAIAKRRHEIPDLRASGELARTRSETT